MSVNHESLVDALIAVQNEVNAPKNKYNKFSNYNYRDAESILKVAKPICKDHGALITLTDRIEYIEGHEKYRNVTDKDSIDIETDGRFYLVATATFYYKGDTLSVEARAREEIARRGMDVSQLTGATSSYARKYALGGLLAIDDGQDADAMDNTKKAPTVSQKKARKPAPKKESDPLIDAKRSLMSAIDEYAKATGADAATLKAGVPEMDGYRADDISFFENAAATYRNAAMELGEEVPF